MFKFADFNGAYGRCHQTISRSLSSVSGWSATRSLQRDWRAYVQAYLVRRRFLHGVRLDELVCPLTELHQAAARVNHIQFVHAPRRFDDFTNIEALGEICVQRMNVIHTDVSGGVLGDVLVRAKPEVDLDVLADGDAVVVVAKIVHIKTEHVEEVERSRDFQRREYRNGAVEHGCLICHRSFSYLSVCG